jgi:hypothetical protein
LWSFGVTNYTPFTNNLASTPKLQAIPPYGGIAGLRRAFGPEQVFRYPPMGRQRFFYPRISAITIILRKNNHRGHREHGEKGKESYSETSVSE